MRASAGAIRWAAAALFLLPGTLAAQEATRSLPPDSVATLTAAIAAQLRCPVCRNQSVLESSSELAREMQEIIRERLTAGETPEEVRAYFVGRYGEWILLKPRPTGVNLLVYVLPGILLLAGGWLLWRAVKRWIASPSEPRSSGIPEAAAGATGTRPEADPVEELSEEDEAWLERAIREG